MHQIKDHKKQIESRLQMLRKINNSKGSVSENIESLEEELEPLRQQRNELMTIMKAMQLEKYVTEVAAEKKEAKQTAEALS